MLSGSRDNRGYAMDYLVDLFPHLPAYLELVPVFVIGLCSGLVAFFSDKSGNHTKFYAFKSIITSAFLTIVMYGILSGTDLPYLAKVMFSCAVGFFGVDRAIEIAQSLIAMKGSRSTNEVDSKYTNKKDSKDEKQS